ncbi:MAG: hypothetical protein IPG25_16465 [Proteobacteria bacterium]|nr:hypothetical protein [Pseudomonadota bacterium]
MRVWRWLRIAILLVALVVVATGALLDRWITADWDRTLIVGVFPIPADDLPTTQNYVSGLTKAQFASIEQFFQREAKFFGLSHDRPIRIELYPAQIEPPPALPPRAGMVTTMWWSLRLRWYTWRAASGKAAQIRIFALFHDPVRTPSVPHSLGLQKGLIGVVYAFADPQMAGANNIVIAHELMHTLGASDKYAPATNLPQFPGGYGDPEAQPRYPQRDAEIMAGRRAISATEAQMPPDLDAVVVGEQTAREIGWTQPSSNSQ